MKSALENATLIALSLPCLFLALAVWDIPAAPSFTICGFRNLTGLPCPGCGMTRGLSALLHGELRQAIQFNPFVILMLLLLVILWLRSICVLRNQRAALTRIDNLLAWRDHRGLTWSLLLALGVFWVWRVGFYLEVRGFPAAIQDGWLFRLCHQLLT